MLPRAWLAGSGAVRALVGVRPAPLSWRASANCGLLLPRLVRSKYTLADWEPVKTKGKKRSRVLISLLVLMPVISFGLGLWQIQRLHWKQDLIARAETQLWRPPLELPPTINPAVVQDFNFRRVAVRGEFDHAREMLVGPRLHEGKDGYYVVTPLRRAAGAPLLVTRGWISKAHAAKASRPASLPTGEVSLTCMLRDKPKPNSFTPDGNPAIGMYHFMDIEEMARRTGSQPVYLQAVISKEAEAMPELDIKRGVPLGFPAKVEFRNTHFQYIVTWFGLSAITAAMLVLVLRQRQTQGFQDAMRAKVAHAKKWQ